MRPKQQYLSKPKDFWAHVRTISEAVGYTERRDRTIKVPSLEEIRLALLKSNLRGGHLFTAKNKPTRLLKNLREYFEFRADALNRHVEPRLMNHEKAELLFNEHFQRLDPKCPLPLNKQKGNKKTPAYLTGLVNMLIETNGDGHPCDYDPRGLTTVTRNGVPLRTFARRVDGAFPSRINPIAIWEVKEYYYTTTFGSRVADGVYETLLDGMEVEELREHEGIDIKHYLMLDAHYTWWECGRSYLCRVIDMLHMGYVDEVLFGAEVVDELPRIVKSWVKQLEK